MTETRRIEKYGILKLLPEERGALKLTVFCDIIQLPFSEYLNTKTNPSKSHYGYVCFMYGEYVLHALDIQFRRQILVDRLDYITQAAYQENCNAKKILQQVTPPPGYVAPDTTVDYPVWQCTELRFKLEPGVVINVFKTSIPMVVCENSGVSQPQYTGIPPNIPPVQSPPTSPDGEIPLSPPYEGTNDNGNTYVRDIPQPPAPVNGDCWNYKATGTWKYGNSSGAPGEAFEVQVQAIAGSWSGLSGQSPGELYVYYKKCGETAETLLTNGYGGVTGSYQITPISKVN